MRAEPGKVLAEGAVFVCLAALVGAVASYISAAPSGFAIWIASIGAVLGGVAGAFGYGVGTLSNSLLVRASRVVRTVFAAVIGGGVSGAIVLLGLSALNSPDRWLVGTIVFLASAIVAAALFLLRWTEGSSSN